MSNPPIPPSRVIGRGRRLGSAFPSPSTPPRNRPSTPDTYGGSVGSTQSAMISASGHSRVRSSTNTSLGGNRLASSIYIPDDDRSSQTSVEPGQKLSSKTGFASTELLCPICNEGMITLSQLNRHLDDAHQNLEIQEQAKVKTLFSSMQSKPSSFPFSPFFNFLRESSEAVEAFSNTIAPGLIPPQQPNTQTARTSQPEPVEHISKAHFQRPSIASRCTLSSCHQRVSGSPNNGSGDNCRRCGRIFCQQHLAHEMKLSYQAAHDPVRGHWFQVCEACFKSKEGYNDHQGAFRDLSSELFAARREVTDTSRLETSRLETRLTKLTQALAELPTVQGISSRWSLATSKTQTHRALEQSIVSWEDNSFVPQCPLCRQAFSPYALRRHHCRLCGRVVCSDPVTQCSSEIGLHALRSAPEPHPPDQPPEGVDLDIRMCRDCSHTLFNLADFRKETEARPQIHKLFSNLKDFETGIKLLLPTFHRHLRLLQNETKVMTASQLQDAAHSQKVITNAFTQYDRVSKMIRELPADNPTSRALHKAVHQQASDFLHLHMGPLKTSTVLLTRRSKAAKPARGIPPIPSKTNSPSSQLSRLNLQDRGADVRSIDLETGSHTMSVATSSIAQAEAEEQDLHERLIVLEEQHFFVTQMVSDAEERRAFDEMAALTRNLEDLTAEINNCKGQLDKIDFAALHRAEAAFLPRV